MKKTSLALILAGTLIVLSMLVRLLPHPANFTPLTAAALFAGVYLPRRYAVSVPLAAMILSDILIGFHDLILFTWGSFVLVAMIGWWVRRRKTIWSVAAGALAGSTLFFLITNWAVMQFGTMYPHSWSGLIASYVAGLPFFRTMIIGDLFYSAALFGLYEAVRAIMLSPKFSRRANWS